MKRHTHVVTLYNFDIELCLLRSIKFSMSHFKLPGVQFEINKAHVLSSCEKTCSTSTEF